MANLRNPLLLLPALSFLIPVNVCLTGNWAMSGIQWALIRVQSRVSGGLDFVSFTQDPGALLPEERLRD